MFRVMAKGKTRKEIAAARLRAEAKVMSALIEAADSGLAAPTNEALQDLLGCASMSTPVSIVQSLEAKGFIRVERFQRARRITIVATGKSTSVASAAPHWRARPKTLPILPEREILRRKTDFSDKILSAAKQERVEMPEFMLRLMWAGWLVREASIQDREWEQGMGSEIVDTIGAAERTGLAVSTLEKLRGAGTGPRFVKLGRAVRYRVEDLDAFIETRVVSSTSAEFAN